MDVDSAISISVSLDAMTATVAVSAQFKGEITRNMLQMALVRAGIKLPPDNKLLDGLLADRTRGENISGKVIARGLAPVPAQGTRLVFSGDPNFPVFPGDMFAHLELSGEGQAGRNLFGEVIPPDTATGGGSAPAAFPEKGVTRVGDQFFALRHGLVESGDGYLGIKEVFYITSNQMELKGTIFSRDFSGRPTTVSRVRQALLAAGITLPPCLVTLRQAMAKAQSSGKQQDGVLIVSGLNPRPGQDGYLDMHVRDQRFKAGITDAHGRIDYRQRGRLPTVAKGALIATYVEATAGQPGRTLDNRYIPNMPGLNRPIRAGTNVRLADDKLSYYALADGLLILQDDALSVSEVYYVHGNVDMHTGHLEMERGSIHVKGSVISGFRLNCPGSIVVEKTVEDARLTAGGDIEIGGGLVMGGKGLIRAGGNVACLFASKARIDAEGDVSVINELTNCQVLADGNVMVTGGNSKIIGGVIQAGESISALEIGTALGSRTVLHLGLDEGFLYKKNQEAASIRSNLNTLEAKLGPGNSLDILARFPPDEADEIAKLIHARNMLAMSLKQLEERIARCGEKIKRGAPCVLKVLGTIHPGTVLHCRGKNMTIRAPLEFSQISFDPMRKQFKVTTLQLSGQPKAKTPAALTP